MIFLSGLGKGRTEKSSAQGLHLEGSWAATSLGVPVLEDKIVQHATVEVVS